MKKNELQIAFDLSALEDIVITEEKVKRNTKIIPQIKAIGPKTIDYDESGGGLTLRNLYNKDINNINSRILTAKEEQEYFEKIRNGDTKAREEFVKLNLKLVLSVANKYSSFSGNFTELDIIQEGNVGLLNAIAKYDPSKGNKFSTFAVWWIHQSIKRALEDKTRTVRVPNHRVQKINRINKFINNYKAAHSIEPDYETIAKELGETVQSIKKTMSFNNATISLNNNFTEEKDTELGDIISNGFDLEEEVVKKDELAKLSDCIKLLSNEEKEIINLKFYKNYKISQIERLLGIPRTKINKILENGLKKMRKELNVQIS